MTIEFFGLLMRDLGLDFKGSGAHKSEQSIIKSSVQHFLPNTTDPELESILPLRGDRARNRVLHAAKHAIFMDGDNL